MAPPPLRQHPRPARPRVIVTRSLPSAVETRMCELFDTEIRSPDAPMDRDTLIRAIAECDVLVPTITDRIDASLIAAAPDRLGLIANFGNGTDHIDLAA